ncbi:MAG: thioredoxin [Prevotella sp.]|jgi:thioredoxin
MKYHHIASAIVLLALTASCNESSQKAIKEGNNTNVAKAATQQTNPKVKQQKKGKKMVTELTAEMFKERIMDYSNHPDKWSYKGTRPAIIDFYATWCGPCKATAPVVEKLSEEYNGKIDFYKVDVDQQEELAGLFGVQSIPTLLFIPTEGNPVKSVGAMGYEQFKEAINEVFNK